MKTTPIDRAQLLEAVKAEAKGSGIELLRQVLMDLDQAEELLKRAIKSRGTKPDYGLFDDVARYLGAKHGIVEEPVVEEMLLKTAVIEDLCSGVRELVVWLNKRGFDTCDSGDGTQAEDMECAVAFPMIAILSDPDQMMSESIRLRMELEALGLSFGCEEDWADEEAEWPAIQATYNPVDGVAVITLIGVLSKDVGL